MSITMHTHRYDTRSCYASHQIAYNTNVHTNANTQIEYTIEPLQSSGLLELPK